MKNLLTFSILLFSYFASAQENKAQDINKIISDRAFVFVAEASFGGKPEGTGYWQKVYPAAPENALEKDASVTTFLQATSPSKTSKAEGVTRKSENSEFPVFYIKSERALFHPSIFEPAYNEMIGRNPESLNNQLAIENYTAKVNKKGNIVVNFKVNVHERKQENVKMIISPNGQAEMWIAKSSISLNRYPKSFKGYIQDLASL